MNRAKLKSLLVSAGMSLKEAMQRLSETAERILFVVDKKERLLGTVTDGDIRGGIIRGLGFTTPVSEVMNPNFKWVSSTSDDIRGEAKSLMLTHKIGQIPVLKDRVIVDVILWIDLFGEVKTPEVALLPNQVVIMAGGKGTRLDPFTKILPKPLIPLGDKPIIEIIIERFSRYGFHKFIFTLNYKKEYMKMFLSEINDDYTIDCVDEEDYMGTAGSLCLLKDKVRDTFFVSNCDVILDANYPDILKWHKKNKNLMTLIGCHKELRIPYGIIELENGILKGIREKPSYDFLVNTGVYVLEPEVISLVPKGHMDMNVLIERASEKGRVSVYPIHEGWLDTGQWEEYRASLEKLEGKK